MRVALCLSGQARFLPLSVEKLKWGVLEKNPDVDVFLHTWFSEDQAGKNYSSAQPAQDSVVGTAHPDTVRILLERYKPKKYVIEPQREFPIARTLPSPPEANQEGLMSMFYSMWKANQLKQEYEDEHAFQYDCVIRTRYDLAYYDQLDLSLFNIQQLQRAIWIPETFQEIRQGTRTLSDVFAMSTSENMDAFCGTYPNYVQYVLGDKVYPPFGEDLLGHHVLMKRRKLIKTFPLRIEILHRVIDRYREYFEKRQDETLCATDSAGN